jgi:hypothetical protein
LLSPRHMGRFLILDTGGGRGSDRGISASSEWVPIELTSNQIWNRRYSWRL